MVYGWWLVAGGCALRLCYSYGLTGLAAGGGWGLGRTSDLLLVACYYLLSELSLLRYAAPYPQ